MTNKAMNNKTILIIGATGAQGGSVTNVLLKQDYKLMAYTRNAKSDSAQALAKQGVSLIEGDLTDISALTAAMAKADTVFAVTTPFESGTDGEVQHGYNIANAAKAANVEHLVFSSVSDANNSTGVPHFDSKYKVEQRIVENGLNYTFIAPVFFMENHITAWSLPSLKEGKLSVAMPNNRKLQQVSVKDIGVFAATVIAMGEKAYGIRVNIAGDELTGDETASILSVASGRDITFQSVDPQYLRSNSEDLYLMFKWFDDVGYSANLTDLLHDFAEVKWQSLNDWANKLDWSILD